MIADRLAALLDIRVLSARLANSPATLAQPAPDLLAAARAVLREADRNTDAFNALRAALKEADRGA